VEEKAAVALDVKVAVAVASDVKVAVAEKVDLIEAAANSIGAAANSIEAAHGATMKVDLVEEETMVLAAIKDGESNSDIINTNVTQLIQ